MINFLNYEYQFVWWGRWVGFHWWAYPRGFKKEHIFKGKPIFYGLILAVCEIRLFPKHGGEKMA